MRRGAAGSQSSPLAPLKPRLCSRVLLWVGLCCGFPHVIVCAHHCGHPHFSAVFSVAGIATLLGAFWWLLRFSVSLLALLVFGKDLEEKETAALVPNPSHHVCFCFFFSTSVLHLVSYDYRIDC